MKDSPDVGQSTDPDESNDERSSNSDRRRDPDALVRRAGARGNPDRDQHFLVDDRVLDRIPTYLPSSADCSHLLEIGGGAGALTDRLIDALPADGQLTVIERDGTFTAFLREEFANDIATDRLEIVAADALEYSLPPFTACVSNLPYGVSSELAFRLLPKKRPLVLMFQREFAERMVAEPDTSEYGRLSVGAQHYADVEIVEIVPPEAFDPSPAVDSAIVRGLPRDPDYHVEDEAFFLGFVKALFTQRRKTIRNGISNTAHISGLEHPDAVVEATDESILGRRPGTLSPKEFAALAELAVDVGFDDSSSDPHP